MRRRGFAVRFSCGAVFVGVVSVAATVRADETSASDVPTYEVEAAPRHDRVWPTTRGINLRIDEAFTVLGRPEPEVRDEAATRNGRSVPETVPMPPPPVAMAPPKVEPVPEIEVPLRGEQVSAYATPQARPNDAIEAVLNKAQGLPISVPMPKRRPPPPATAAVPTGDEGDGAASAATSTSDGRAKGRVAALSPDVPGEADRKADAVTEPMGEAAVFGEPKTIPKEALPYLAILRREAAAQKVPLWLAIGVGWVESKYNPRLRGTHGVVGIMQVMPSTARFQGYKGTTEQLLDAETNIVWGIRELAWDWQKANGNACLAIAKYKGGIMTRTIPSAAASYCAAAKRVTGMN